jgi:hypothetical protein
LALRDPVAAYNAANNLEAAIVSEVLNSAGIEAHVVEDTSVVGMWMFGLLPEIHKPQVWIERSDVVKAKPVLEEYERRQPGKTSDGQIVTPILVICEECNQPSEYPASRRGTIETCEHCGAYVDVEDSGEGDWSEHSGDDADD